MKLICHYLLPDEGGLWCGPMPGYSGLERDQAIEELKEKGVETVVCLIPERELDGLSPWLLDLYKEAGIEVLKYPIDDFSIPQDEDALRRLLQDMLNRLGRGQKIYMHCYAGIGRTGTVLACLLKKAGLQEDPVEETRSIYLGVALQGQAQKDFVRSFEP